MTVIISPTMHMIPHITLWVTTNIIGNELKLTDVAQKLFTWFTNNQMKSNHDKCYLLLSTKDEANIQTTNVTIKSSMNYEQL